MSQGPYQTKKSNKRQVKEREDNMKNLDQNRKKGAIHQLVYIAFLATRHGCY
jgi:hypothetical protein